MLLSASFADTFVSERFDDVEFGNTPATAFYTGLHPTRTGDRTYSGTVSGDDPDVFRLAMNKGDSISLVETGFFSTQDLRIDILSARGDVLQSVRLDASSEDGVAFAAPANGQYFVRLSPVDASQPAGYVIAMTLRSRVSELELRMQGLAIRDFGGTIGKAVDTRIRPGNPVAVNFEGGVASSDIDMAKVRLAKNGVLLIELDRFQPGNGLRYTGPYIQIFDAQGRLVDRPDVFELRSEGSPNSQVDFTDVLYHRFAAPAKGDYFVAVSLPGNVLYNAVTGKGARSAPDSAESGYSLILRADETNGTIDTAVNAAVVSRGELEGYDDADIYRVEHLGGAFKAELKGTGGGLDGVLRMFDSSGQEITSAVSSGSGRVLAVQDLVAGEYFVGVSSSGNRRYNPVTGQGLRTGTSQGGYRLHVLSPKADLGVIALRPFGASVAAMRSAIGRTAAGANQFDLYTVELEAGQRLLIDVDAARLRSPLDALVRVFNSDGAELARNDDGAGFNEKVSLDAFLAFTAPADGTYTIGVSSAGNASYSPSDPGSGQGGTTVGDYHLLAGLDNNLPRQSILRVNDLGVPVPDDELDRSQQYFFQNFDTVSRSLKSVSTVVVREGQEDDLPASIVKPYLILDTFGTTVAQPSYSSAISNPKDTGGDGVIDIDTLTLTMTFKQPLQFLPGEVLPARLLGDDGSVIGAQGIGNEKTESNVGTGTGGTGSDFANNTTAGAVVLRSGKSVNQAIGGADPVDYYRYRPTRNGRITLNIATNGVEARVLQGSLPRYFGIGTGNIVNAKRVKANTTYFIEIKPLASGASKPYRITLNFKAI